MNLRTGRRGFFTALFFIICLVITAACAFVIYAWITPDMRGKLISWQIGLIGYADYSGDIAALYEEQRYDEAEKWARFVKEHPELPGQDSADRVLGRIDAMGPTDMMSRGLDILSGVISGGGRGAEETLGGFFGNIIRSYGKRFAGEMPDFSDGQTDYLSSELEKVDLGLTTAWFPGTMRTLYLSGFMSDEYWNFLMEETKRSIADNGRPTTELQSVIQSTKKLVQAVGIHRMIGIHKYIKSADDLAAAARWGSMLPQETYIVVQKGGLPLLRKLSVDSGSQRLLTEIAKRGENALKAVEFWIR